MSYDQEILRVLTLAGKDGLKTSKIAHHVFNSCNSLFDEVSYKEIHGYVSQYLIRNSKNQDSIIERTDCRGIYRINFKNKVSQQLLLKFSTKNLSADIEQDDKEIIDNSLSLW
nr:hypothetical protein [Prevotella sp.]